MLAHLETRAMARVPRPYQVDGVAWLRTQKRAFLTDGFGLGKTAQAIWAAEWPVLVAAPVHLLEHWRREILACYPSARVLVATQAGFEARKQQLVGEADFYVCNIELLRTPMVVWFEPLRPATMAAGAAGGGIKTFIVDEAHRLRGRNSQQSLGARQVAQRVPRVYLLTATPVYNRPDDLYHQLHMLDATRFSSYYKFQADYLSVLQTPWGPRTTGLKKDKRLKDVFKEYAMGRTREDVQAQLPALQESLVELTPGDDWYAKYERLKLTFRDDDGNLLESRQGVLQKLRGMTQTAKLQAVCQLIQDGDCASHTLIYTYHKDLAYAIGHLLKAPVITGDMAPSKREEVARSNDFVVATFPSVAEGLNLSHMRNVIFVEQSWEPGMIDQAINRVHRPGNPHTHTNLYHVVVKRTVDTIIYNAVKHRGLTMDEIVDAALVPFNVDVEDVA